MEVPNFGTSWLKIRSLSAEAALGAACKGRDQIYEFLGGLSLDNRETELGERVGLLNQSSIQSRVGADNLGAGRHYNCVGISFRYTNIFSVQ